MASNNVIRLIMISFGQLAIFCGIFCGACGAQEQLRQFRSMVPLLVDGMSRPCLELTLELAKPLTLTGIEMYGECADDFFAELTIDQPGPWRWIGEKKGKAVWRVRALLLRANIGFVSWAAWPTDWI